MHGNVVQTIPIQYPFDNGELTLDFPNNRNYNNNIKIMKESKEYNTKVLNNWIELKILET